MLHQGTKLVPCDMIGLSQPLSALVGQHDLLIANLFAQAEALASRIVPELDCGAEPKLSRDTSTNALIQRYR